MKFIIPDVEFGLVGIVTLLLFFVIFIVIAIRAYQPSRKDLYKEAGRLPLDDTEDEASFKE